MKKRKKVKKIYVETNLCFCRDAKNKNIMIYAFEPLRIVKYGDFFTVVKKRVRGAKRKYLIKNDLLQYEV